MARNEHPALLDAFRDRPISGELGASVACEAAIIGVRTRMLAGIDCG
jgi:hypothetical protein